MTDYNLGTASGRIEINGDLAAKGFKVAQAAAQGFFNVIQSKLDSMRNLGLQLAAVGAVGSAGMALAIKTASDFQTQLSGIEAVSGATADQMDQVREKALKLGADSVYSASEAAGAMENLVKAGFRVEDMFTGAADAAVSLAAAGDISLERAAEIAANASNMFKLNASELPHTVDLIAGAANASSISVEDFAQSMNQAGSVAQLVGVSFDDIAVAIAEMGKVGIKGSDAGTSLKTMLMNLQPVTERQISTFDELGITSFNAQNAMEALQKNGVQPLGDSSPVLQDQLRGLAAELSGSTVGSDQANKAFQDLTKENRVMSNAFFDGEGNIKSYAEIQEILAGAMRGMGKDQQLATLEVMFGQDAIRAAAVAADNGATGFNTLAESMSKVTAQQVAETRMNNLRGAIEQFKGATETARIIIGSVFLPMLQKIVEWATKIVNVFNNLPKPLQIAVALFIGLGSAIALIVGSLIALLAVMIPIIVHFVLMKAVMMAVGAPLEGFFVSLLRGQGIMNAFAVAQTRVTVAMSRFVLVSKVVQGAAKATAAAWAIMTGPIGWVIAGVALLVAGLVILYKNVDGFREVVDNVGRALNEMFMPTILEAVDLVKNQLGEAWKTVTDVWTSQVLPALQQLWSSLQENLIPALKQFYETMGPIALQVLKVAAVIVGALVIGLIKLSAFLTSTVTMNLVKFIAFLAGAWLAGFSKAVGFITNTVIPALKRLADFVGEKVVAGWQKLVDFFNDSIKPAFDSVKQAISDNLIPALQQLWQSAQELWSNLQNTLGEAINSLRDSFQQLWQIIQTQVIPVLKTAYEQFKPTAEIALKVAAVIGGVLFLATMGMVKAFTFFTAAVIKVQAAILGGMVGALNTAIQAVSSFLRVMGAVLGIVGQGDQFSDLADKAEGLGKSLQESSAAADQNAESQKDAGDAAGNTAEQMDELERQTKEAEQAQKALNTAQLAMKALNAGQTITEWIGGMEALSLQIAQTTDKFSNNTQESRANATTVRQMAGSAREAADAMIKEAEGTGRISEVTAQANQQYANRVQELLNLIPVTNANIGLINELKSSAQGVPPTIKVTAGIMGAEEAKARIKTIADEMNITPKALTVQIRELGANPTKAQIQELAKTMSVTPKTLRMIISALGAKAAQAEIGGVSQEATTAAKEMPAAGKEAGQGFGQGLDQTAPDAQKAATNIGQTTVDSVNAVANAGALQAAGVNLMQGFVNGMNSMNGSVQATAQSIANQAKATIENALEIHSPSRWGKKVGVYLMEGLAQGVKTGNDLVQSEIDKVLKAVMKMRKDRLQEVFKDTGNDDVDKKNRKKAAKNKKKNAELESKLMKKAQKAINKDTLAALEAQKTALGSSAPAVETLYEQLGSAQDALKSAQDAWKDYRDSVAQGVKDTGSLVNIWASQTSTGMIPTFESLAKALQESVNLATNFDAALNRINDLGLDPAIISQLVEAGVGSAGQVAAMISTMSPEEINKLNQLQGQLAAVADRVGTFAADKFRSSGIAIAQGIVDGLNSQIGSVIAQITELTNQVAAQIAAAIGAAMPANTPGVPAADAKKKAKDKKNKNKKKKAIGGQVSRGQDYLTGERGMELITASRNAYVRNNQKLMSDLSSMYNMIKPVERSMKNISSLSPRATATPVQQNSTSKTVNVEVNNYNPVAEPSSITTKNIMTKLAVIGVTADA